MSESVRIQLYRCYSYNKVHLYRLLQNYRFFLFIPNISNKFTIDSNQIIQMALFDTEGFAGNEALFAFKLQTL